MVAFHASSALLSFALLATGFANAFNLDDIKRGSDSVIPGRYIVEFDSRAHLTSAGIKRAATAHEYIYKELDARSSSYTVHQEYACDLFFGASLSIFSDADLAVLLDIAGVIDLRAVHLLTLPAEPLSKENTQWPANSPHSPSSSSASAIASAPSTSAPFSNLPQIQADAVQATGNKGKGIKVGIIDGGVDYTREPLGGCFGSGCKIAGGYDFVGDNYDGSNDPVPDNDPYDNCYSHGTFISGIIGANQNIYGAVGVAPEASLYVYRVFGCNGAASDDIVLAAMQKAYDDDMDVINLSLGEPSGWTESTLSVFASRVVAKGTVVTVSAGNQGQVGGFYSSSPAAGKGVINVGSSDSSIYPAHLATVSTGYGPIAYYNYKAYSDKTLPLYTFDSDIYGCTLPDDVPDLSPYLVIVRRGECSLSQKAQNAYNAGGTAIFVVNDESALPIYQDFPLIDFALISYDDGNYLLNQLNSSANTTVSFSFNPIALPNIWTANTTSYFSEIGPTNDLYFAPSVLAPGTNVVGVMPTTFYNWTIADGTSYSSAYAAGAAALYLAAKGTKNISPSDVLSALGVTAQQLPVSVSDSSLVSVAVQGAGRLQLSNAIHASAVISPSEITLNDTANFDKLHVLTIKNPGNKWVTYKLSHEPAGTALAFQSGLNQSNDQPLPQVSNAASVNIFPSSLTLWPGQSLLTTVKFTAPTGLDAQTFPIYSGFIKVTGGGNTVKVPYMGVAASMKDMPVLDPTDWYLGMNSPAIVDVNGDVQQGSAVYTFSNVSYPSVLYRLAGGTPLLLIDLIDANANLTFTPDYTTRKRSSTPEQETEHDKRHSSLSARRLKSTWAASDTTTKTKGLHSLWCHLTNYKAPGCSKTGNTFQKVPIVGNVYVGEYLPRSTDNADGQGGDYSTFNLSTATFSNGTSIPNGDYQFLMRALHITGDKTKESDYESWVSQPFTIAQ
ncbi:peptidase [Cryptococcus neoformans Ze90-1]|nr:peptidase [Cryptococcus neoformans var. grubii Ze90-1]